MKKGALLVGYARVSKLGAREDERGANANSQVEKPEITGHGQSYLLRLVAAPLPLSLDGPFSVFLLINEVGQGIKTGSAAPAATDPPRWRRPCPSWPARRRAEMLSG